MNLPNLWILIAAQSHRFLHLNAATIRSPAPEARQDFEKNTQAHVAHDSNEVVKALLVVKHDDSFPAALENTPDLIDCALRVRRVMENAMRIDPIETLV